MSGKIQKSFILTAAVIASLFGSGAWLKSGAQTPEAAPSTIRLLPEDQQRAQNGHQHNFYFLAPGQTGEDYQSAGFFGQKLRPLVAANPEAVTNLNRYRRQKTLFLLDRLLLVGAVGLYGQQVLARPDGDVQYFNAPQKVAVGLAAFGVLSTVFVNRNTNAHFQRAVEAYNAGLPTSRRGALWPRLQPSGVGVGAAPGTGAPVLALRWQL